MSVLLGLLTIFLSDFVQLFVRVPETGAADLLGEGIVNLRSGVINGYIIGFAFYVVGFLMTTVLYNRAISTVLVPGAVIICNSIGCDPRGPVILCACSRSNGYERR